MITYIIVGIICFLIGGAFGMAISNEEETMFKNNSQPQIYIILDGKVLDSKVFGKEGK